MPLNTLYYSVNLISMEDLLADASHVLSSHQAQKLEEKEKDLEKQGRFVSGADCQDAGKGKIIHLSFHMLFVPLSEWYHHFICSTGLL